jgi:membrane protein required for colicin V production
MNQQMISAHVGQLNWVDYSILAIITVSVLISFIRGFVREVLSLLTWVAAFFIAFNYWHTAGAFFAKYVNSPSIQMVLACASIFIGVLIVGAIVNYFVSSLVDKTGLGGTDRVMGMALGGIRGGFIVVIMILLAGFTGIPKDTAWQNSQLIPKFQKYALELEKLIPSIMDFVVGQ